MQKVLLLLLLLCSSVLGFSQGPTAQFSATPLVVCEGEVVSFTDASTQGTTPIVQWAWDFGDGNSATTQNTSHAYNTAGIYTVILVVTDQNSIADPEVKLTYITVNPNPIVLFSANTNSCTLPVTASFTNQSSSGINYTYAWDFGNGQTSILQNPNPVIYNSANTYSVSLNVINTTTNCHSSISNTVTISDFNADFIAPDSICIGSTVVMDDNSTLGVNNWSWNSGNGQVSIASNPSFTYNTAGTYTISLTAQNTGSGCTSTTTQQIVVVPLPIPTFTANPTSGCIPLNVIFTNTTAGGSNFHWNFGDGTFYDGQTPPTHVYTTNNTFSVTLTSTGPAGCVDSTTMINLIHTIPSVANFIGIQSTGCTPLIVDFSDLSTTANSIADPIVSWLWDFGDGTTFNGQSPPNHTYTTGLYNVTLTITTQAGCTDVEVKTNYIQVGLIDAVTFSNSPGLVCAKSSVDFVGLATISVPHNPNEVIYNWNFGDGGNASGANMTNTSWSYPIDTGYFSPQLIVNFRGCLDTFSLDSSVYIKAPISLFSPAQIMYCNPASFPVNVVVNDNAIIGQASDDVKMIWKWNDPLNSTTTLEDADLDPDDDGSSSFNYNTYGSYTIEQVVYNYTTGCSDSTTQTFVITETDANFTLSSDSICKNGSVILTSTSTSLDPLNNFWYTLGNGQALGTNPTNYTYINSGTYSITLTAINIYGCSNSISHPIVVLELPSAQINGPLTGCAPLDLAYTNGSIPQGNGFPTFSNFLWTFPDGSTQVTNNPAIPTNPYHFSTQGVFNTTLVATDGFGCVGPTASISMTITLPVPNFTLDSVVCDLEVFDALNSTTGAGVLSYEWSIDNIPTDNTTDLNYFFDEATDTTITNVPHTITLYATDENGCIDSISKNIIVSLPFANVDYTATSANLNSNNYASCPPVFETYDNQSTSYGTFNSNWNFGDGKTSVLSDPANTYVFAGTYTLNLEITDQFGCVDDTTLVDYLTIGGPIINYSITPSVDPCDNQYIFDTLSTENVSNFVWNFGDGSTATDTVISHNYPQAGTYNTSITIYDSTGCVIVYPSDTIVLNNQINAFFVATPVTAETGTVITFDDQSIFNAPGVTWNWEFGDFDSTSLLNNTDANTSFSYEYPYFYTVTLTITDQNGCTDEYQALIHITGEVHAPNVFTPNGDGTNDIFEFPFDLFKTYDVIILNRWGEQVYERKNETGTYIWNGTKQEKEQCSEGVYYYLIKGYLLDDSSFETTGFVTKI